MRKLLIIPFLLLASFCFGQYPGGEQFLGNDSNRVRIKGLLHARVKNLNYFDTTAANRERVKGEPGTQIYTTVDNGFWIRNSKATQWLRSSQTGCRGLQYGGIVVWQSGFLFNVAAANYCINNKNYNSASTNVTLVTADNVLPRLDVIAVDTFGQVVKITGTPAVNPAIPQIDIASQVYLTSILVPAASTQPSSVSKIILWDENTGTPEYVGGTTGVTADFSNTLFPYNLTRSTNVVTNTGGKVVYTGATYNVSDAQVLQFFVRFPSLPVNIDDPTRYITLELLKNGNPTTLPIRLDELQGLNPLLPGVYQSISIPISRFVKTSAYNSTIDGIKFVFVGSNSSVRIDYISLNSGVVLPPGSSSGIDQGAYRTITQPSDTVIVFYRADGTNDTLKFLGSGGTVGSTGPPVAYTTKWSVLDSVNIGSASTGNVYQVSVAPTGAFVGHPNEIATYNGTAWVFETPIVGDLLFNVTTYKVSKWNGISWIQQPPPLIENWWTRKAWDGTVGQFIQTGAPSSYLTMLGGFNGTSTGIGTQVFTDRPIGNNGSTAIGALSQLHNTAGAYNNTSVGYYSMWYGVTGHDQVAMGIRAANTGNKVYSISFGTDAGNNDKTLSISDSTTHMYMKLDSLAGTAPSIIGKDAAGNWHTYAPILIDTLGYVRTTGDQSILGKKYFQDSLIIGYNGIEMITTGSPAGVVNLFKAVSPGVAYPWLAINGTSLGSKIIMGANNAASGADIFTIDANNSVTLKTGLYRAMFLEANEYMSIKGSSAQAKSIRFVVGTDTAAYFDNLSRLVYSHSSKGAGKILTSDAVGAADWRDNIIKEYTFTTTSAANNDFGKDSALNKGVRYEIDLIATTGTTSIWSDHKTIIASSNGTTTTVLNTQSIGTPYLDAALTGTTLTATVSGNGIILRANGLAATTILWKVHVRKLLL